jgi:hypothetical protein
MLGVINKWTWFDKLNPVSKLSQSARLSGEMPILVAHTGIPLTGDTSLPRSLTKF